MTHDYKIENYISLNKNGHIISSWPFSQISRHPLSPKKQPKET